MRGRGMGTCAIPRRSPTFIFTVNTCGSCYVAGRLNVKQEEIDDMLKEAPGPINFTVFLTMFGEKLKGKMKR